MARKPVPDNGQAPPAAQLAKDELLQSALKSPLGLLLVRAVPCRERMSGKRPAFLVGGRCRRLVTASIAWETASVTACSLAMRACASTSILTGGRRSVTGLA